MNETNHTIERDLASLHKKIDKLDEAVRGNGHPGINTRLDRLEHSERRRTKIIWILIAAAIASQIEIIVEWLNLLTRK